MVCDRRHLGTHAKLGYVKLRDTRRGLAVVRQGMWSFHSLTRLQWVEHGGDIQLLFQGEASVGALSRRPVWLFQVVQSTVLFFLVVPYLQVPPCLCSYSCHSPGIPSPPAPPYGSTCRLLLTHRREAF